MIWIWISALSAATFIGIMLYAGLIEPFQLRIRHRVYTAPTLQGRIRLLHLGDYHLWRNHRQRKLVMLQQLEEIPEIDVILLTGDYVDQDEALPDFLASVRNLVSNCDTYAVFGNHEFYRYTLFHLFAPTIYRGQPVDHEHLQRQLQAAGIHYIGNQHHTVPCSAGRLVLIGVNDLYAHENREEKAFLNAPQGDLRIVVTHSPELILHLDGYSLDLVIAGHTHGGQFWIPGWRPIASRSKLPPNLVRGFFRFRRFWVSITSGLGEGSFFPFRFCCPPEAVVLDLEPGPDRKLRPGSGV